MRKFKRSNVLCHSYYVLFGMAGAGLLPSLMRSFEDAYALSHAQMGLVIGLSAVVLACGGMLGGRWYDRAGPLAPLSFCMVGCAAGAVFLFAASTVWWFVAALFLFQFGNGLGVVVNPLIRRLCGTKAAAGINLLHGFQGIGRFLAPVLVAACIRFTGGWRPALLVAAALFVVWFFFVLFGFRGFGPPHDGEAVSVPSDAASSARRRDPVLWLGVAGFFFLAGGEAGLIFWVPNYLESEAGFSKMAALTTLTWMMVGYTGVRLGLGFMPRLIRSRWLVLSVLVLVVDTVLLMHTRSDAWVWLFGGVMGAAIGAYWPCHMAAVYERVARGHGLLTGATNLVATFGSLLFMVLIGCVADRTGLTCGISIAVAASSLAVVLHVVFRHLSRPPETVPPPPP